ncbi:MAG: DinB family protein [Anaerolineales bacterium]|nr:DinB family protein [Anaerolineales bacterium]
MSLEMIRTFFEYDYWAFELVWERIEQLTDTQFTTDTGYSRGSIRNQVIHLISSHRRWMQRLQGIPVNAHLVFGDFPTHASVKAIWDKARVEFMAYIATLDPAQLDESIPYAFPARGIEAESRRWELLLHIANHATDHRAQILSMLATHFSIETPEQDLLFYLLESKYNHSIE